MKTAEKPQKGHFEKGRWVAEPAQCPKKTKYTQGDPCGIKVVLQTANSCEEETECSDKCEYHIHSVEDTVGAGSVVYMVGGGSSGMDTEEDQRVVVFKCYPLSNTDNSPPTKTTLVSKIRNKISPILKGLNL